uniref:Testis expressed 2, like n=1 Tax=Hippocampus comes TaxID=109280 RepID=A0A3Q2XBM2_HIPCM
MAESGNNWAQGCEKDARGDGGPHSDARSPDVVPNSLGTKRHLPRGIVIQLTGTEGEWSSLDESELIFSLDHDEYYASVSHSSQKHITGDDDKGSQSQAFHVPLSPSSPGSLGNCSAASPAFLSPGPSSPTHRPLASLVKSLSTELELRENSALRPKPLLSLVKSISTELSRSEPEVSQSKSDSRLNLHLLKQLTQPKNRSAGDSRTAPPSPSALSPSGEGHKGGFFKMELEDTKRKLSEAVHEPFSSMFNKIRREDSTGSPKHTCKTTQVISRGSGREASTDAGVSESPVRSGGRTDGDFFHWPSVRYAGRSPRSTCPVHHCKHLTDEEQGFYSDGDAVQVFSIDTHQQAGKASQVASCRTSPLHTSNPPPCLSLFCVAIISYGYFTLPLNPYFSGLALGVAMGFLLGLLLIRMGSSRSFCSAFPSKPLLGEGIWKGCSIEPDTIKGWMNEIHDYGPETYHSAQANSVFATLEGSRLRLDTPQSNISRRAACDEKINEFTFTKTRTYQLEQSKVFLLPSVLARKRLWNPKYPICIQLASGVNSQEEVGRRSEESREVEEQPKTAPASSFQRLPESARDPATTLYLFGRTGREKEEWFHHFLLASTDTEREKDRDKPRSSRCSSRVGSSEDDGPSVPAVSLSQTSSSSSTARGLSLSTLWVNALIGRIFWDFLREKSWADAVSHKIQKKLSKIKLPYFMNELTLTELDMGCSIPKIISTSRPEVNHRGLWVELQLAYNGTLQMTLQTKFNLSKLGKDGGQVTDWLTEPGNSQPILSVLADSDEESSSAGSSDEEEFLLAEPQGPTGEKGPSSILRFVDKIAKSKYFQKATENEFIKKKFEEMSNTPLLLTVEVQELSGSLVVNIPPPPTDRIWYSFCVPPKLDLRVRPKLGEREVTLCHVTEWIEKKLQDEFQKVFVLPNMDDIYLPMMHSSVDNPHMSEHPSSRDCQSQSSTESMERIPPAVT